jgi:hypothetical protein
MLKSAGFLHQEHQPTIPCALAEYGNRLSTSAEQHALVATSAMSWLFVGSGPKSGFANLISISFVPGQGFDPQRSRFTHLNAVRIASQCDIALRLIRCVLPRRDLGC